MRAFDLEGNAIEIDADDLLSRALQHETDHVLGKVFIDYFNPATLDNALVKLREFESRHRQAQTAGEIPSDEDIKRQLDEYREGD